MWQRFTERARKVVFYSQEEAQKYGEGYVSTEHLLLGLLRDSDTVAAIILTRMGHSMEAIQTALERQLPRGERIPSQDMTLTPRAKRVIDLAYDEARHLGNTYIGTEHILLGLVREGDGLAGRVLESQGVQLEATRAMTAQVQAEDPNRVSGAYTPPPAPVRQRTVDLRVHYDLRFVHPVDQMLIALLSDAQSSFGEKMRERCSTLDWLLPAIVGTMTNGAGARGTLEQAMGDGAADLESLYKGCFQNTSEDVQAVLRRLNLFPEGEEEE